VSNEYVLPKLPLNPELTTVAELALSVTTENVVPENWKYAPSVPSKAHRLLVLSVAHALHCNTALKKFDAQDIYLAVLADCNTAVPLAVVLVAKIAVHPVHVEVPLLAVPAVDQKLLSTVVPVNTVPTNLLTCDTLAFHIGEISNVFHKYHPSHIDTLLK
jgi:hypothetical protein